MNSIRNFLAKPQRLLVTAVLCLISFMVYAQYAVNYDGTTYKVDPRIWRSNRAEILVELGTNAGGGTIFVTNYVYATNYVYTTNSILVTNFVNTTNFTVSTNFVYTTNYTVTTNYVNITNNPAANVALLDASYQEFTGSTTKFTGKLFAEGGMHLGGDTEVDNLVIGAASFVGKWPVTQGGTDATNATQAQINLGLQPDVNVQTFRLALLQLAIALGADGDMGYRNAAGIITNLTSTAAGRALLSAVNAAAQWALLQSSATTNGAYSSSSWDGITDKVPNLDQIRDALVNISNSVTSAESPLVLSNGTLSLNTNGLVLSGSTTFDPFAGYDEWSVYRWGFDSGNSVYAIENGLQSVALNSGNIGTTNYVFNGSGAMVLRAASNVDTDTGYLLTMGGNSLAESKVALRTNVNIFSADFFLPTAGDSVMLMGWGDYYSASGSGPSDALGLTLTNMLICPVAISNATKVVAASTYRIASNVNYRLEIFHTNTTARFIVYSNSVSVSDQTITSGIPIGPTNLISAGFIHMKNNGSTALTNQAALIIIDKMLVAKKLK